MLRASLRFRSRRGYTGMKRKLGESVCFKTIPLMFWLNFSRILGPKCLFGLPNILSVFWSFHNLSSCATSASSK